MAYNNITSRTDAAALIPEEVSRELIRRTTDESAVLSLFRRVPVGRAQVRIPIISALPVAYWVNGDTGLKQTTETELDEQVSQHRRDRRYLPRTRQRDR
jgi:HK97 family phage major capsid protein